MEIIKTKLKFIVIVFIGMVSLLFIYERIGYNNYSFHYINKSILNSIVINSNNYGHNATRSNDSSNKIVSSNKPNSSESKKIYSVSSLQTKLSNRFSRESQSLRLKVNEFESKYLIPIRKRSKDSKLLYTDIVKQITITTIGDKKCDQSYGYGLKVVIIVISRVDGFRRRQIIRETWAERIANSKDIKLYFAIGLSNKTETQKQIIVENNKTGDILQWNFIDNYYNLTVKSLAILRWITLNCFQTEFVYKVDDDCIVNIENLIKFSETASKTTIYGHLWKKAFVDRKSSHKFFISKSDYKYNSYPDYTGGPWLISGAVVPLLYKTAITESLPALPYEDVYITGVVASKARLARKQLSGLVYFSHNMFNQLNNCWFKENIIFWQNLDNLLMTNVWKNILNSRDMICIHNGSTVLPSSLLKL